MENTCNMKEYKKDLDAYHNAVPDIVEKQPEKETTSTQFAEEYGMTDQQVNEVIKANEEAVASNKNEIWISAVLADEFHSRLNHLYTTFKSVVYDKSNRFTDRDKITVTDDRCEALIAVDPKQLEVFIANLKYAAEHAADLVACVPEKPIEKPIHPNKAAIAEPKNLTGMMSLKIYQMTEFTHMLKNWKRNIVRPMARAVMILTAIQIPRNILPRISPTLNRTVNPKLQRTSSNI